MVAKTEKSAKDKAFERERVRLQRQIRDLQQLAKSKDAVISSLRDQVNERDDQIRSLNDWVDRLLAYMELSKEDVRKAIEKDAQVSNALGMFTGLLGTVGGLYG